MQKDPAAPLVAPFEACVGDAIRMEWSNFPTQVDYLEFKLKDGSTFRVYNPSGPNGVPASQGVSSSLFTFSPGCNPVPNSAPFCGRFNFTIPSANGGAVSGPVKFYSAAHNLLFTISWVIPNPIVSLGALDPSLCSEDTIPIIANPAGGTFNITAPAVLPGGTTSATFLVPTAGFSAPWNSNGYSRLFIPNPSGINNVITKNLDRIPVTIVYNYTPTTSNGAACPVSISASQSTTVFANYPFLMNFQSMPIARVLIENNLLPSPSGITAPELGGLEHPAWTNRSLPDIDFVFSGTYVDSGRYFMGDVLGAGNSSNVTLDIANRNCTNSATTLAIVQNPSAAIPPSYCQHTKDTFLRSDIVNGPSYSALLGFEFNHLEVTCFPYPGAITVLSNVPGGEAFIFNPSNIPGGTSVVITFQYYTTIFGSRFDGTTLQFTTAIIGSTGAVPPNTYKSFYCHDDPTVNLSAFTPTPDSIMIRALTGPQAGMVVANLTSAPFTFVPAAIHPDTFVDTDYRLIFRGGPCGTVDSFMFRINGYISPYFIGRHANLAYCRNEYPDLLQPFPLPSTGDTAYFSGHSSVDSLGVFNPLNTGNGLAIFPVTYNFVSIYGCRSSFTDTFTVNPVPTISLTSSDANNKFCANDTIGYLIGIPTGGSYIGPTILNASDTSFQPNAVYAASGLTNTTGYANYYYIYADPLTGCRDTSDILISINPIPQPTFSIAPYFCESAAPILLTGSPNIAFVSQDSFYLTVSDTSIISNGYYHPNPAYPSILLTAPRVDTIVYQVADGTPCIGRDTQMVTVFPNPVSGFVGINTALDTTVQACLGQDTLRLTPNLNSGISYFAGPGILFGTNLFVADVAGVGPHNLTLFYQDTINHLVSCRDTFITTFFVHSTPNVNFAVDGGCGGVNMIFEPNNAVLGLNRFYFGTTNLYDSITTVTWDMGDGIVIPGGFTAAPLPNRVDTLPYLYLNPGVYLASLYVENRGYCSNSDTVRVIVLPTTQPSDTLPYFQDFEADNGGWLEEAELGNQSSNLWSWNLAMGPRIRTNNDATHLHVWTTNATGPYGQNAAGWVYSPCIDLTQLERPMLKLDYFNDTDPGNDGVVVEYYSESQGKWVPLGNVNRGINWYNYNVIAGRPGLQDLAPKGWSGFSGTWKDGRYALDDFRSYTDFRFRVAFGAVGVSNQGLEGFAFDNVWIGNRTRNVLLEHFSNSGISNFNNMNHYVYNLVYGTPLVRDVVLAQFNTSFPNISDDFNNDNSDDPSGRVFNYGLSESGKSVINGKNFGSSSASSVNLLPENFEYDMLESPKFDIQLSNVQIFNGNLQVTADITANQNMPLDNYYAHVLVLEDSMHYNTGEQVHSVLRKMLPDAAGTYYPHAWTLGQSENMTQTWVFNPADYNAQNMQIVVFIQKDQVNIKDVFQVVSTRDITNYVAALGTKEAEEAVAASQEVLSMNLYPNPAQAQVKIEFDKALSKDYDWSVYDLLGQQLRSGTLRAGEQRLLLDDFEAWSSGVYLFVVKDPQFTVQRKFVILKD